MELFYHARTHRLPDRAKNHPHKTPAMEEAIAVFEAWVAEYKAERAAMAGARKTTSRKPKTASTAGTSTMSTLPRHTTGTGVACNVGDLPAQPSKHSFKALAGPSGDATTFLRQAARDAREGRRVMRDAVAGNDVACSEEVWVAVFGGLGAWLPWRCGSAAAHHITPQGSMAMVSIAWRMACEWLCLQTARRRTECWGWHCHACRCVCVLMGAL